MTNIEIHAYADRWMWRKLSPTVNKSIFFSGKFLARLTRLKRTERCSRSLTWATTSGSTTTRCTPQPSASVPDSVVWASSPSPSLPSTQRPGQNGWCRVSGLSVRSAKAKWNMKFWSPSMETGKKQRVTCLFKVVHNNRFNCHSSDWIAIA